MGSGPTVGFNLRPPMRDVSLALPSPVTGRNKGKTVLHYLRMFVVGIIVGIIARFVYPGAVPMGWIMSGALGIAGSFVGGLIGNLINKPADGAARGFHPAGFLLSIVGAVLLIFVFRTVLHIA